MKATLGTIVLSNIWAMTHDENVYPDPFTFKPERFFNAQPSVDLWLRQKVSFLNETKVEYLLRYCRFIIIEYALERQLRVIWWVFFLILTFKDLFVQLCISDVVHYCVLPRLL
jgi:hypothetical protein